MDNRSFEDRLRSDLHDAVADVEAAPLPRAGARRARSRQFLAVAAVLAVAVAVGATTVTLLTNGEQRPNVHVAAPEAVADQRGSGGTSPCYHRDLEGQCVAYGRYDEDRHDEALFTEWWLGAHMDGDDLCVSDEHASKTAGGGGGMACGPYDPDKIGFGVTSSADFPHGIASGEVPGRVDRLLLERSDGPALELELYSPPEDFPLDVLFYNVFLPDDARALVAYDAAGNEVARHEVELAGDITLPKPEAVSPRTVIASGEEEGHPWTFEVREEGAELTPCTQVMFGRQEEFGGGGSCYPDVPARHPIGFSQSSFERGPDVIAVFGVVDSKAAEVFVLLERGDGYNAEVFEGPDGFRDDVSYYVAWIPRKGGPPNPPGRVIAYESDGTPVGQEKLCGDIAAEGGTCGN